jgi:uncharacterized protein (TIGR04222 family)
VRRLRERGLLMRDDDAWKPRAIPGSLFLLLLLFGLAKIGIGVSRDRPVTLLAVLCVLTAGMAALHWVRTPERSRRGDRALDVLKLRNVALQYTAAREPSRLAPNDLALAVGLYGAGVIATGPLADVHLTLRRQQQTTTDGSSSGSGCSSSSSGCGGGCGGGGCGGCGG